MNETNTPVLTDNVRIISISGQAGLGKSTLGRELGSYLLNLLAGGDYAVKCVIMPIMADQVRIKMCELFNISKDEYLAKKNILRPFLEEYGVMERRICGEDNAILSTLLTMNIMFGPLEGEADDKAIVIVDDVRFLNQGMKLAAHPDTLSMQLIPAVPVPEDKLWQTERELSLFAENIPSLRTFVAKMPVTITTIKAVTRSWLEKDSMKEWLKNA